MPTRQSVDKTEGRTSPKSAWVVGRKKKREQNIFKTLQYLYLHILTLTENSAEVLKPPQRTLFIGLLLPCYITSATTGAIAAAVAGGAGAITQSGGHGRCTGPRSLRGITCVLLWLRPVVWVLRCPGGSSGTTHGVDLREQSSSRLVFCIVL